MIKFLKSIAAVAVCVLSANSFATVITDFERVGVETKLTGGLFSSTKSISWTHDITEHNFAFGFAESASLEIELKDDANDPWYTVPFEFALIQLGVLDLQDGDMAFEAVETWVGNLGFSSLAKLNLDGTLDVTVTSIAGDFIVGKSTLTVNVPESSSLMLFGLGLLGLGLMRRKARA